MDMKVWELQTQIQVLTNKLKQINAQRRRLRSQAPYIKQGLITAEQYGATFPTAELALKKLEKIKNIVEA